MKKSIEAKQLKIVGRRILLGIALTFCVLLVGCAAQKDGTKTSSYNVPDKGDTEVEAQKIEAMNANGMQMTSAKAGQGCSLRGEGREF